MDKLRVLIAEDEMIIAWDFKRIFESLGCETLPIAAGVDKAVETARLGSPDLILMERSRRGQTLVQGMYGKPPSEAQLREMLDIARAAQAEPGARPADGYRG